jgi:hypothetical protein
MTPLAIIPGDTVVGDFGALGRVTVRFTRSIEGNT